MPKTTSFPIEKRLINYADDPRMDIMPTVREALRTASAEITKLREREREVLKWANCGGPPALKTCSVDGHAIYGSFTLYPDGSTVCELHATRAVIATLRSQVEAAEGIAEALKETLHLLGVVPMSYPYNDRSHEVRGKASQALARWDEARKTA